jgi:hypothetical protein
LDELEIRCESPLQRFAWKFSGSDRLRWWEATEDRVAFIAAPFWLLTAACAICAESELEFVTAIVQRPGGAPI